jgi:hypothetical protein
MNSYKNSLNEAINFLETLPVHEHINAIWDVLHQARWHKGIDWVRWMDQNKPLINQLIEYRHFENCPDDLRKKIWNSISEFKELDR